MTQAPSWANIPCYESGFQNYPSIPNLDAHRSSIQPAALTRMGSARYQMCRLPQGRRVASYP
jgi:hypothetical protein